MGRFVSVSVVVFVCVIGIALNLVTMAAARRGGPLERAVSRVSGILRLDDKNIVVNFGQYAATDPVLGMAEDFMLEGRQGFPEHPHRGFETVTLVLKGRLRHRDSTGHSGLLEAGAVVWMTAGSGIIHSEFPDGPELCHCLQLWLNLPAARKMTKPAYQQFQREALPALRSSGVEVTVMAGDHAGTRGPVQSIVPTTCLMVRVQGGSSAALDLPRAYNAFVYVIEGAGRVGAGATPAVAGDVLWFDPVQPTLDDQDPLAAVASSVVPVTADRDMHLLLFGGQPIREPVFHQGPFVLHTREALQQAFRDFQTGRFIQADA